MESKIIVAQRAQKAQIEYWDAKRRADLSGDTSKHSHSSNPYDEYVYPCIFYDNSNDGRYPWTWTSQHDVD